MSAYYNENNPFAAQWLRNLIIKNLIAPGDVDERSIANVQPDDLKGYAQCHFFAGIGGWSLAARLAGWDDERPLWTGSCPCQPFSVSGKREGFNDPRHLWPEFKRLIAERQPSVVFGEQSAAAASWLALVRSDLEAMGYAMGAIPMEAASAGAEHFRDRYWFVADYDNSEWRTDDPSRTSLSGKTPDGKKRQVTLQNVVLSFWSTLRASDGETGGPKMNFGAGGSPLPSQVFAAGNTLNAPTENGGRSLHPEFAGWEMGYPPEWISCAGSEMPSTRAQQLK
ncbi:DNA cytosine methyltransferase [Rhizobium leguminosarum]|uniref:DNA cytosine methyltransferase n=1 Tax=Rhizobium leguminosarum TaxID=384 RepID=UPI001C93E342|nr:DNA cytosine methyltransferase [Rhizobium leguminosarum]MBY5445797.1 DNA cytosine methyltransferase [Rhizobium leguminosarum]